MKEVLEKSLWERDVQYIVLGSGEWQYESFFRNTVKYTAELPASLIKDRIKPV